MYRVAGHLEDKLARTRGRTAARAGVVCGDDGGDAEHCALEFSYTSPVTSHSSVTHY